MIGSCWRESCDGWRHQFLYIQHPPGRSTSVFFYLISHGFGGVGYTHFYFPLFFMPPIVSIFFPHDIGIHLWYCAWEKCAKRGCLKRLKRAVTRGKIADFFFIYLKTFFFSNLYFYLVDLKKIFLKIIKNWLWSNI